MLVKVAPDRRIPNHPYVHVAKVPLLPSIERAERTPFHSYEITNHIFMPNFNDSFGAECDMTTSSNGNSFRVTGPLWRELVNSPHKGQWRGALIFSFICAWINGWVNNRQVGVLRLHRALYDVIVVTCEQHELRHKGCSVILGPGLCLWPITWLFNCVLLTKQWDILPQNFVKFRSHEIGFWHCRIVLKLNRRIDSTPVKFHCDWII